MEVFPSDFGYWDECAHCVWFIESLSGVCVLRIRLVSEKKKGTGKKKMIVN